MAAATSALGYQGWRDVVFVHWPVRAEALSPRLPPRLRLDAFDGQPFVSLVAITVTGSGPRPGVWMPGVSRFEQINLRTYVRLDGGEPAVWFFSVDTDRALPALAARLGGVSTHRASIERRADGPIRSLSCRRRWPAPPERLMLSWRPGPPVGPAPPETLEHFLVERYVTFVRGPGRRLIRLSLRHRPWVLRPGAIMDLDDGLIDSAGLPPPASEPLLHQADSMTAAFLPPALV